MKNNLVLKLEKASNFERENNNNCPGGKVAYYAKLNKRYGLDINVAEEKTLILAIEVLLVSTNQTPYDISIAVPNTSMRYKLLASKTIPWLFWCNIPCLEIINKTECSTLNISFLATIAQNGSNNVLSAQNEKIQISNIYLLQPCIAFQKNDETSIIEKIICKNLTTRSLPIAEFPYSHFDGIRYFAFNPNVFNALLDGQCENGLEYYMKHDLKNDQRFPFAFERSPNIGTLCAYSHFLKSASCSVNVSEARHKLLSRKQKLIEKSCGKFIKKGIQLSYEHCWLEAEQQFKLAYLSCHKDDYLSESMKNYLLRKANYYYKKNEYVLCLDIYKLGASLEGDHIIANKNIINALCKLGKTDEAVKFGMQLWAANRSNVSLTKQVMSLALLKSDYHKIYFILSGHLREYYSENSGKFDSTNWKSLAACVKSVPANTVTINSHLTQFDESKSNEIRAQIAFAVILGSYVHLSMQLGRNQPRMKTELISSDRDMLTTVASSIYRLKASYMTKNGKPMEANMYFLSAWYLEKNNARLTKKIIIYWLHIANYKSAARILFEHLQIYYLTGEADAAFLNWTKICLKYNNYHYNTNLLKEMERSFDLRNLASCKAWLTLILLFRLISKFNSEMQIIEKYHNGQSLFNDIKKYFPKVWNLNISPLKNPRSKTLIVLMNGYSPCQVIDFARTKSNCTIIGSSALLKRLSSGTNCISDEFQIINDRDTCMLNSEADLELGRQAVEKSAIIYDKLLTVFSTSKYSKILEKYHLAFKIQLKKSVYFKLFFQYKIMAAVDMLGPCEVVMFGENEEYILEHIKRIMFANSLGECCFTVVALVGSGCNFDNLIVDEKIIPKEYLKIYLKAVEEYVEENCKALFNIGDNEIIIISDLRNDPANRLLPILSQLKQAISAGSSARFLSVTKLKSGAADWLKCEVWDDYPAQKSIISFKDILRLFEEIEHIFSFQFSGNGGIIAVAVMDMLKDYVHAIIFFSCSIEKTFCANKPRAILNLGSDRSFFRRVILNAAQSGGVKTFAYEYLLVSTHPRYAAPIADYMLLPAKCYSQCFINHFLFPECNIKYVGCPQIELTRKEVKKMLTTNNLPLKSGARTGDKIVLYATQHGLLYKNRIAIEWLCESAINTNHEVLIRLHPGDISNIDLYRKICHDMGCENLTKISFGESFANEIIRTNIVITLFSNIGIAAAALGVPVISFKVDDEPFPLDLEKLGLAQTARSKKEAVLLIREILNDGSASTISKSILENFERQNPELINGNVADNIANCVLACTEVDCV